MTTCKYEKCNKKAYWGIEKNVAIYCKAHGEEVKKIDDKIIRKVIGNFCKILLCFCEIRKNIEYCPFHKNFKNKDKPVEHIIIKKCLECNFQAHWGVQKNMPIYCKKHGEKLRKIGDVTIRKVIGRFCKKPFCWKRPTFGDEGEKPEHCKEHKKIGQENIINKRCKVSGCNTIPSFGYEKGKPTHCAKHIQDKQFDVINKLCEKDECKIRASYGKNNIKEFCVTHKPEHDPDYKIIGHIMCEKNCGKQANFGSELDMIPLFCALHKSKTPGVHYDVLTARCQNPVLCRTKPNFGYKSEKATHCKKHQLQDHICLAKYKQCEDKNCENRATHGLKNTKIALFCKDHITKKIHFHVREKICEKNNCCLRAIFGNSEDKIPHWCSKHKNEDTDIDVVHKLCQHISNNIKCKVRASFGLLFSSTTHCVLHKSKNMYYANKINPKCSHSKCTEMPCYTDQKNNYPLRCETHQIDKDKNVIEKPCEKCKQLYYIANGNLCNDCGDYETFKMFKAKENRIRDFLITNNIPFVQDKRVWEGCSNRRPDFIIDCGTHYIFLEIDENRHEGYDCYVEQVRMNKLHLDVKLMRCIFIRYNPDNYRNYLNELIHGAVINPSREKRLLKLIRSIHEHIPTYELTVIYVCYNGDDGRDIPYIVDSEKNTVTALDDITQTFQEKLVL